MEVLNIHHAKTHLSKLVEKAASGESFIIAKAGKPMVQVTALVAPEPKVMRRFDFMKGEIKIPHDFDTMMSDEIQAMFHGDEEE